MVMAARLEVTAAHVAVEQREAAAIAVAATVAAAAVAMEAGAVDLAGWGCTRRILWGSELQ